MLRMNQILVLTAILVGLAACSAPAGKGPFEHPAGLGVKGPDGVPDVDIEEGRTLIEKGDYDAALTVLLKARKRHPDAPELQYLLAEVHQATGQCLKAASHLAQVGTDGDLGAWVRVLSTRWIRGLADGTVRCSPPRKAATAVDRLLGLSPDLGDGDLRDRLATLLTSRARDLEGSGRCKDALQLIERAESLGGSSADGVLLRGRCLLRRGRNDEILSLAKVCLERTPPAEDTVAALARRAEETFRHEAAISLWSLLRNRQGSSDEANASLGRLQLKVRRPEEAAGAWRAFVEGGAEPAERLARAMEAAQQLGEFDRFDDAVALLDAALAERPDDLPAVRLRATLLWRSARRPDAVVSLLEWMDRAGDRAAALESALELLSVWEGWSEGLKLLYKVRTDGGGTFTADIAPAAYLYTGLFRTRLGDLDEAGKAFDSYLGAEGHVGRARARIGALLFTTGDAKRALPWLEAAVSAKPRWPAAAPDLASVYHSLDLEDRIPALFDALITASEDKGAAWAAVAHWWAGIGRLDEALSASTRALTLTKNPSPLLLLLHGRLLLVKDRDPDQAYPLLEDAAAKLDAADLLEVWRLVAQRPGRQASCVRAAILRRPEARIGATSGGRRALLLPGAGVEGIFPLSLDAELNDLLGCGRGELDARIEAYLAEARSEEAALAMATTLARALLDASFPDRVAALFVRFPGIPAPAPSDRAAVDRDPPAPGREDRPGAPREPREQPGSRSRSPSRWGGGLPRCGRTGRSGDRPRQGLGGPRRRGPLPCAPDPRRGAPLEGRRSGSHGAGTHHGRTMRRSPRGDRPGPRQTRRPGPRCRRVRSRHPPAGPPPRGRPGASNRHRRGARRPARRPGPQERRRPPGQGIQRLEG
ncbi:MAG: tetratricopeptide repeat protein [Pseudomonadota bacterium]